MQGEGFHVGRPAVFIRLSGCNLWNGREMDRMSSICKFCDTDFVGTDDDGGTFDAIDLAIKASELWPGGRWSRQKSFAVITGGEPGLQLRPDLISALHSNNFEVAVETNGTFRMPPGIDWITVSPKAGSDILQKTGNELKLVYPQVGIDPELYESLSFDNYFIQPMDGPLVEYNTQSAIRYCMDHPRWRLSLQTHKIIGNR